MCCAQPEEHCPAPATELELLLLPGNASLTRDTSSAAGTAAGPGAARADVVTLLPWSRGYQGRGAVLPGRGTGTHRAESQCPAIPRSPPQNHTGRQL